MTPEKTSAPPSRSAIMNQAQLFLCPPRQGLASTAGAVMKQTSSSLLLLPLLCGFSRSKSACVGLRHRNSQGYTVLRMTKGENSMHKCKGACINKKRCTIQKPWYYAKTIIIQSSGMQSITHKEHQGLKDSPIRNNPTWVQGKKAAVVAVACGINVERVTNLHMKRKEIQVLPHLCACPVHK